METRSAGIPTIVWVVLAIVIAAAALMVVYLRKRPAKKPNAPSAARTETAGGEKQAPAGSGIVCSMAQTVGARQEQQDSMYCSNWNDGRTIQTRGLLAAVSDGIGGLKDGNVASQTAMQTMRTLFHQETAAIPAADFLLKLAAAAQKKVYALNANGANCGATLVSVLIRGRNLWFLSIGDSHIYLYRAGALLQLNREHTLGRENAEKQTLTGKGEALTAKRAGALTSYLGKKDLTLIDRSLQPMKLLPGDRIVLMSDGVFNTLSDDEIIRCLRTDPASCAQSMITAVDQKQNPRQDNASVVVISVS